MISAIYPGSFDPLTFGHTDVLQRAMRIFDKVIVAVVKNPEKSALFTLKERVDIIKEYAKGNPKVQVDSFDGLLVDYAKRKGCSVLLRGIRALSDFEYEFQMALTNRKLADDLETIFMMPSESYSYLSSRMIKEIARLGGDISKFVPTFVAERVLDKMKRK